MFHWICPECGREIAPTVRECPVCDPSAVAAEPSRVGVLGEPVGVLEEPVGNAAARSSGGQPDAARADLEVAPAAQPVYESVPSAGVHHSAEPAPAAIVPLARNAKKQSAFLRLRRDPAPSPAVSEPPVAEPAPMCAEPILPQLGAAPTGDPLADLSALMANEVVTEKAAPAEKPAPTEPPRSDHRFPIAAPVPAVPPTLRAWIATLGPATLAPVTGSTPAKLLAEPPLVRTKIALPDLAARNMRAATPPVSSAAADFVIPPASKAAEPQTPYSGPAPALAPLTNYSPLAGRPLRPAVPSRAVLQRELGLRSTLPGPMLTPPLARFRDRELNPVLPQRFLVKKRLIPGWAATVLIVGTVLVAGFNSIFSVVPRSAAEVKVATGNDVEASSSPLASNVPPPPETNSLARAIEVTGFRVQMDPAKKPEIQYLVVNHTASRFSGVTVYVTLHAAHEAPGQPPIGRFHFGAPDLKPYESKEMASAIERVNRPSDLPDWQDLRAEVEIGQ